MPKNKTSNRKEEHMRTVKDEKIELLEWQVSHLMQENKLLKELTSNSEAHEMIEQYGKEYNMLINQIKKIQNKYRKEYLKFTLAKKDYETQMQEIGLKKRKVKRVWWRVKNFFSRWR